MSKRRGFTVEFKMNVIKFAEKHSNRETGRKFQVDESMVRRWRQNKGKLNAAYEQPGPSKMKLRLGCGRKPSLATIEDELMSRIIRERERRGHVSSRLITTWAKQMAHHNGLTTFSASRGWLWNFLRRFKLKMDKQTVVERSKSRDNDLSDSEEFSLKEQSDLPEPQSIRKANKGETAVAVGTFSTLDSDVCKVSNRTNSQKKDRLNMCLIAIAERKKTKLKANSFIEG